MHTHTSMAESTQRPERPATCSSRVLPELNLIKQTVLKINVNWTVIRWLNSAITFTIRK